MRPTSVQGPFAQVVTHSLTQAHPYDSSTHRGVECGRSSHPSDFKIKFRFFNLLSLSLTRKFQSSPTKMSFDRVLAIVGGLAVVYHLLKLAWRSWCGLGDFVLSEVWQVDLTTYGKWAGTVETSLK